MRTPARWKMELWGGAALICWTIAMIAVIARAALLPHRALMLPIYEQGARDWLQSHPLYGKSDFVYGPLAAAFFASLLRFPSACRPAIWLVIDALVFLAGVGAVLWTQLYPKLEARYYGIVLLLLLPLLLGNFDMSQANPLVIGLIMLAVAAAWKSAWNAAALFVALASVFKIYPIVIGLLLVLIAPRQFSWRLLLVLLVVGLFPFLLHHPAYVRAQYQLWFATRLADNRLGYPLQMAPIDLWLLLVRLGGLSVSPGVYRSIQVLSGIGIAVLVAIGGAKGWDQRRLLVGLFSLACIWMTLCGPATEGLTYALLAPAVVFAAVNAFNQERPAKLAIIVASLTLFLLTVAKNSFAPHLFGMWTRAMQPVAALLFLGYCLLWLIDETQWRLTSAASDDARS